MARQYTRFFRPLKNQSMNQVAAIASSFRDRPLDEHALAFGEVGLVGDSGLVLRGLRRPAGPVVFKTAKKLLFNLIPAGEEKC